jgi:hypothetical protein
MGIPEHGTGVVVAVGAERLTESGLVLAMADAA